jgi:hypothetical protein
MTEEYLRNAVIENLEKKGTTLACLIVKALEYSEKENTAIIVYESHDEMIREYMKTDREKAFTFISDSFDLYPIWSSLKEIGFEGKIVGRIKNTNYLDGTTEIMDFDITDNPIPQLCDSKFFNKTLSLHTIVRFAVITYPSIILLNLIIENACPLALEWAREAILKNDYIEQTDGEIRMILMRFIASGQCETQELRL